MTSLRKDVTRALDTFKFASRQICSTCDGKGFHRPITPVEVHGRPLETIVTPCDLKSEQERLTDRFCVGYGNHDVPNPVQGPSTIRGLQHGFSREGLSSVRPTALLPSALPRPRST